VAGGGAEADLLPVDAHDPDSGTVDLTVFPALGSPRSTSSSPAAEDLARRARDENAADAIGRSLGAVSPTGSCVPDGPDLSALTFPRGRGNGVERR